LITFLDELQVGRPRPRMRKLAQARDPSGGIASFAVGAHAVTLTSSES